MFWLGTGFALGVAAATKASRTTPGQLAQKGATRVAGFVQRRVADAVAEGKAAMHESEAELRAVLAKRPATGRDIATGSPPGMRTTRK